MKLKLFVILLTMMLILPSSSLAESRYMTTTATTVNGLSANAFSTLQSTSYKKCWTGIVQTSTSWGIRVWKRSSAGVETEITAGTPVAQVTRYTSSPGQGLQSATWVPPSTSLSSTDSIVVRVYHRVDSGSWYLCSNPLGGTAVFTTEQLGTGSLDPSNWTVYYYTWVGSPGKGSATFYFGSSTYNSRIDGFSYTMPTTTTTTSSTTTSTTTSSSTTTTLPSGVNLTSGTAQFTTSPIYLPAGEINVTGNLTHLDIYWEAYYASGVQKNIGALCFLDCDLGYQACSSAQNCSILIPPGKGACSILNPQYGSLTRTHNVSCTFYDPELRELTIGQVYLNTTFIPINFSVWISSFTSIVGEEFNFPIHIKNSGLFPDSYNVTISSDPSKIYIRSENFTTSEFHGDAFDPHAWQQTGPETRGYQIKMVVLDASSSQQVPQVCVNVTSQQMSAYAVIFQQVCVEIKSGFKSVPELSLLSFLVLALIASAFIFKFKKKD